MVLGNAMLSEFHPLSALSQWIGFVAFVIEPPAMVLGGIIGALCGRR